MDGRLSPRSLGLLTHLPCPSGHESTAAGYRAQGTGDTRVQPRPLRRAAASGASHAAPVTRRRGCMCHPARRPLMSPIHHTHTRRRALPRQRTLSTAINSSTAHRPPAPPVASTPSLHPLSLERLSSGRPPLHPPCPAVPSPLAAAAHKHVILKAADALSPHPPDRCASASSPQPPPAWMGGCPCSRASSAGQACPPPRQ